MAVVPDFHNRILFSDEAHFWLNGYVNKQNCRIWSEDNPQVYVETPVTSRKTDCLVLLPHDFETRHLLSLHFLARLEVDPEWPWNILWTDEAHFHLDGSVNILTTVEFGNQAIRIPPYKFRYTHQK
ncbi:uncharacterized protein TNCV_3210901 [Trichonephila clavipes]|nr:uncharacterized protein TNCV_3210901 [Trichonephila clavipes]